jgi:hypothetical protein
LKPSEFFAVADFDGDPDHPILHEPFLWELVEFTYRRDRSDWRRSYIDMVFAQGEVKRRLRFFAPQGLEVRRGLPSSSGMCILDVSGRQMEGLRVRVANFEGFCGVPQFWAAEVIEVSEAGVAPDPLHDLDSGGS